MRRSGRVKVRVTKGEGLFPKGWVKWLFLDHANASRF